MTERYRRPGWVRHLNAMGAAVGGAGHVVPIDAAELVDQACGSVGSDDFGELGDGDWRGRLDALVAAVNHAELHVVGRLMTREELLRSLVTRLVLAGRIRRDPTILDEEITAPVVITGPARSGTSILFELLCLDAHSRGPAAADVLHPCGPDGPDEVARRAMAGCEQELWAEVQPEFAALHELRSDLPVEDITISIPSFAGSHWSMVMLDPGDWQPDPVADFAFHRRVLQAVQHGEPRRTWVLKTPGHLIMLDALYAAYPDAQLVVTHRDPARTMPSTVSTTAMVQWLRTDHVGLDALSELIGAAFVGALNELASRATQGTLPTPHAHVAFAEVMADPVAAVGRAHADLGREFNDDHAAAIRRYLGDKPRGKHGVHRYTAAEWGFDVGRLRGELDPYIQTFGVALEEEPA